ncbi:nucleotide exchange factor GrpE [[Limnothrix rosea] IAM M-220]|uniref:nucleotide exchange factor GrpE n=1 Tax=[Limnothrix rosea] IAM M-220 TaxID=454133 RepID=UPI0009678532|nr:nucleotide exchange factor GrpE [[Limnothrix rosea] IAM M-220]OKH11633.1 nucleotide exchange factor GrpE [[Limnothrix rosea] IAM M-220]
MAEDAQNLETSTEDLDQKSEAVSEETLDQPDSAANTKQEPLAETEVDNSPEIEFDESEDDTPLDSSELEAVIAALQQEITTLRQQLTTQTQQADNFKTQYMRIAADFENFRKRTSKEKEEMELRIKCNTVNEMLGAVDNFERARLQIKPANDGEMAIHKSYQGVYKQLVEGLKKIGVSAMRPEGEEFDPNLHEAVFQEPTSEYPEGTVIEQIVRGYLLGDKVLRHAMVKVAAAPEEEPSSESSETES